MKTAAISVAALGILVLAVMVWLGLREDNWHEPVTSASPEQLSRGRVLVAAGDCIACHTAPGRPPFSGNAPVATPFGTVYSTNLTPDKSGLGEWTADDFYRALHNGRGKNGRLLYPAFPFPNFTLVTRQDSDAMYAWLRTQPAVAAESTPQGMRFPYSVRALLVFWRALYFRSASQGGGSELLTATDRGRYLVNGLGHCNACHSPRNFAGATITSDLRGWQIPIQNWYAPSLEPGSEAGLLEWRDDELAQFLSTGTSAKGSAYGPMSDVVRESLQYLPASDIQAIVAYLKAKGSSEPTALAQAHPDAAPTAARSSLQHGARLYHEQCAKCHGDQGEGAPPAYPPLNENRSLTMESAANPIRMVLKGGFAPATAGNPRPYSMPPFVQTLSPSDVADVVSYLRQAWNNHAPAITPGDVERYAETVSQ